MHRRHSIESENFGSKSASRMYEDSFALAERKISSVKRWYCMIMNSTISLATSPWVIGVVDKGSNFIDVSEEIFSD